MVRLRMSVSKRVDFNNKLSKKDIFYSLDDAYKILQDAKKAKFDESVEISVRLGVDPKKSDQVVRGASLLPCGTGKVARVAVFAEGDNASAAQEAGADVIGMDDLAKTIKDGELNFDVVIADPAAMRLVGQLGAVLGPRGLMPNPKVGTVTADVAQAVKNAKSGQARFRTDKAGIVHSVIGKLSFSLDDLKTNLHAFLADLKKAKPSTAKGVYFVKISLSSTMGPGVNLDKAALDI